MRRVQFSEGDEPLPGYRLERLLGRGGYGQVWEATGPDDRHVAVKLIYDVQERRGARELQAMSELHRVREIRHAHLVDIHRLELLDGVGQKLKTVQWKAALAGAAGPAMPQGSLLTEVGAGQPSILVVVMELMERSLADVLTEERRGGRIGIPASRLCRWLSDAARALDVLYTEYDVVHCDVKPQNILVQHDSAKVGDYGLAKVVRRAGDHSTGSLLAGTVAYQAPELLLPSPGMRPEPTARSDQFSLAVTYFQLRMGRLPWPGLASDTDQGRILPARMEPIDWSDVPPNERAVLERALSPQPEKRFESCERLADSLRAAVGLADLDPEVDAFRRNFPLPTPSEECGTATTEYDDPSAMLPPPAPPPRTRRTGFAAVVAILALLAGGVAWFLKPPTQAEQPSPPKFPFSLDVTPADAVVSINGEPKPVNARGQYTFELERDQIVVAVEHPAFLAFGNEYDLRVRTHDSVQLAPKPPKFPFRLVVTPADAKVVIDNEERTSLGGGKYELEFGKKTIRVEISHLAYDVVTENYDLEATHEASITLQPTRFSTVLRDFDRQCETTLRQTSQLSAKDRRKALEACRELLANAVPDDFRDASRRGLKLVTLRLIDDDDFVAAQKAFDEAAKSLDGAAGSYSEICSSLRFLVLAWPERLLPALSRIPSQRDATADHCVKGILEAAVFRFQPSTMPDERVIANAADILPKLLDEALVPQFHAVRLSDVHDTVTRPLFEVIRRTPPNPQTLIPGKLSDIEIVLMHHARLLMADAERWKPVDRPPTADQDASAAWFLAFGVNPAQHWPALGAADLRAAIPQDQLLSRLDSWLSDNAVASSIAGHLKNQNLSVTERAIVLSAHARLLERQAALVPAYADALAAFKLLPAAPFLRERLIAIVIKRMAGVQQPAARLDAAECEQVLELAQATAFPMETQRRMVEVLESHLRQTPIEKRLAASTKLADLIGTSAEMRLKLLSCGLAQSYDDWLKCNKADHINRAEQLWLDVERLSGPSETKAIVAASCAAVVLREYYDAYLASDQAKHNSVEFNEKAKAKIGKARLRLGSAVASTGFAVKESPQKESLLAFDSMARQYYALFLLTVDNPIKEASATTVCDVLSPVIARKNSGNDVQWHPHLRTYIERSGDGRLLGLLRSVGQASR